MRRSRNRSLVIAYHNVLSPGQLPSGDASLHLGFADFRAQLDLLQAHCDVVPLGALLEPPSGSGRPRVALTFDDAYRGALRVAVPELVRRGLPATLFVTPGLLGDQSFWWDQAARAAGGSAVPPSQREEALETLRGEGERIRAAWAGRGIPLDAHDLPAELRSATEPELEAAAAAPGITLGAHTWSHPNLTALEEAERDRELREPLEYLKGRFPGTTIPWIAYPYGCFDERVMEHARRVGYQGGLRVEGGWLGNAELPSLATPRMNVPAGLSAERFLLRLARFPGL